MRDTPLAQGGTCDSRNPAFRGMSPVSRREDLYMPLLIFSFVCMGFCILRPERCFARNGILVDAPWLCLYMY